MRSGPIGHVHSVFTHALNVTDAEGLITIADPTTGPLPNGLVLEHVIDFDRFGLRPDDAVTIDDHLRIRDLSIDLACARHWSATLPTRTIAAPPPVIAEALRRALDRTGVAGGFVPMLAGSTPLLPPILQLSRARQNFDLPAMLAASHGAIGLGQGLTPSGDDLLIGFSAALWSTGDTLAEPFTAACAEFSRSRTTDVAVEFYRSAAHAEFSGRLHALFAALAEPPDASRLGIAFEHALTWGATSGADCLLGVLVGLFGPDFLARQLVSR